MMMLIVLGLIGVTDRFKGEPGFPKRGEYEIVQDTVIGRQQHFSMFLDISNHEAFERKFANPDGSNCQYQRKEIENGRFDVETVCDSGDRDIVGIVERRYGTYTLSSVDAFTDMRFHGHDFHLHATYRLKTTQ